MVADINPLLVLTPTVWAANMHRAMPAASGMAPSIRAF